MDQSWSQRLYLLLCAAWRQRWRIIIPVLIFPWVGLAVGLFSPKVYESRTTFLLPQELSQMPSLRDLMLSDSSLKDRFQVLEALLRSRFVMDGVAKESGLISDETPPKARDAIVEGLSASVSLSLIGNEVLELTIKADSPKKSAELLEAISRRFLYNIISRDKQSAETSERFLQSQLSERSQSLQEAEQALARYRAEHSASLPEQQSLNAARRYDLQSRRSEKSTALEVAHEALAQTANSRSDAMRLLDENIARLESELMLLRSRYTDQHSEVQALNYRLGRLKEERQRAPDPATLQESDGWRLAKARVDALAQELAGFDQQIAAMDSAIAQEGEVAQTVARMEREVTVRRELYQDLSIRLEKSRLSGALGGFEQGDRVKVIDKPYAGGTPVNKPLWLFLLAGIVGGIGIGLSLAIACELLDTSLRCTDQLARLTGVPVLGRIPAITPERWLQE